MFQLAALLLVHPAAAPAPRAVVLEATNAVNGDSAAALLSRWTARFQRDSADPEALLGLATLERLTYRYDAALRHYARLFASASRPADQYSLYALLGSGEAVRTHLSFDSGTVFYTRALAVARALRDSVGMAEGFLGLSFTRFYSKGPTVALRIADSAAPFVNPHDPALLTRFHWIRAVDLVFGGRPEAESEARRALGFARLAGDLRLEGAAYALLGGAAFSSKPPPVTIALFDSAEAILRSVHDRFGLGVTELWRGYLPLLLFDHVAARRDFTAALAQGDSSDDRYLRGWALRNLAHLEWHTSELVSAAQHVAQADLLFSQLGDRYSAAYADEVIGGVALDRGEIAMADSAFRRDQPWVDSAGFVFVGFSDRYGAAMTAIRRGDWQDATRKLRLASAYATAHAQQGSVPGLEYFFGLVALRQGNLAEAERRLQRYLQHASPTQLLDRYSARTRLAQVALQRGQVMRAEAEQVAASDELDSLRAGLDNQRLRLLAFQTHRGYDDPDQGFASIIDGLVAGGRVEPAFRLVERRRARELRDHLARLAASPQGSIAAGLTRAPGADAVPALDDSTAVLEYAMGKAAGGSVVFALTRKGLSAARFPLSGAVSEAIGRYGSRLAAGGAADSLARLVSAAVLAPALGLLPAAIHRLVIVPSGVLFQLPFEALPLPDGSPLLERYVVVLDPSRAVLASLAGRVSRSGPVRLLALADPRSPGDALPRLRGSAAEARAVARFAATADVRLRDSASEAFLKNSPLEGYQVLHFATHALVDQEAADRTVLALAPGHGEDGFVGIGELLGLKLSADLVVLSACETASGEVIEGEGIEGLTLPFLEIGARSVVASRWRIGDRRTLALMTGFYRSLARGATAGAALRAAELAAYRSGAPASEWAAFTLVGDPGVRIAVHEPGARWPLYLLLGVVVLAALAGFLTLQARRGLRAELAASGTA